jgi:hypothetical protein
MTSFIMSNWDSILFVLTAIAIMVLLYKRGAKKKVFQMLFYLVTIAEEEFGEGAGQLKFAAVTTWIYERMPAIARFLFTSKQIDNMIEEAVTKMKEYLESNM